MVSYDEIVKVTDEEGIQKVEYTLNGVYYSTDPNNTGAPVGRITGWFITGCCIPD